MGAGLGEYALTWWLLHVQDAVRAQLADAEIQCLQQVAKALFMTGGPFSLRRGWYLFWETPYHVVTKGVLSLFWHAALASGTDPGEIDSGGSTPLSHAAEHGRAALVERLLQQPSVEPNHQDEETLYTAIHHAVFQRHAAVVITLAPWVDVDAIDVHGKTVLAHIFDARVWKTGKELFPYVDSSQVLKLAVYGGDDSIVGFLDQEYYRPRLVRAKGVDWKFLLQSALQPGSKRTISHLLNILQSAPDLGNDSVKGLYAEFRAHLAYETAIKTQPGSQLLLPGPSVGSKRLEWTPDAAPKLELLSVSHPNLARDLKEEPSDYGLLLQMKYSGSNAA